MRYRLRTLLIRLAWLFGIRRGRCAWCGTDDCELVEVPARSEPGTSTLACPAPSHAFRSSRNEQVMPHFKICNAVAFGVASGALVWLLVLLPAPTIADDSLQIAVPGTNVAALWQSGDTTLALIADYRSSTGQLVQYKRGREDPQTLHTWRNAGNGLVVGNGTFDRFCAVRLIKPALALDNTVTLFTTNQGFLKSHKPLACDVGGRTLLGVHPTVDGTLCLLGEPGTSKVILQSLPTNEIVSTISDVPGNVAAGCFQLTRDGSYLLHGAIKQVEQGVDLSCWSIANGALRWRLEEKNGDSICDVGQLDRDLFVVATEKGRAIIGELATGKLVSKTAIDDTNPQAFGGVHECVVTPDSRLCAFLADDGVVVFRNAAGRLERHMAVRRTNLDCISLDDDGTTLVLGRHTDKECVIEWVPLN